MKNVIVGLAAATLLTSTVGCSALAAVWVPQMKVGQCADVMKGASVSDIPIVGCDKAHAWEAYAVKSIQGDAYPGEQTIQSQTEKFCADEFATFVGVAYDDSELDINYLYPTTKSWALGDRELLCLVGVEAGGVTGSLKGAKK